MKFSAIFLLAVCLQVNAEGYSQKVTLTAKKMLLKRVFNEVKKQTGYSFLWDRGALKNAPVVSFQVKDASIEEVMNECLKGQPLTYTIGQNLVDIRPKPLNSPQETVIIQSPPPAVRITGVVLSNENEPLVGASVKLKGTNTGTTTDAGGKFSLEVPDAHGVLVISYVGYAPREIAFSKAGNLQIILSPAEKKMEEVVVVGYGTQKKINISGSVASVSGSTLTQSPAPRLTNLLEGQIAGLTVVQPTGEPGRDVGSLQIRGLGSFGASAAPLVLVDGIVSSISNLNPEDIESVSVLKDAASASIYGARSANGVLLITTKKGKKGQSKIDLNTNFGTTSATVLPKLVTNSAQYMTMYNAARQRNNNQTPFFTQAQIDAYKNGAGNPQYPNTDWLNYYFHNGPIASTTLSLSGGNDISTYYTSVGYQDQKGIINMYDYKRYTAVVDYNTKVKNWIRVGTNINMSYENILAPTFTNDNLILLMYAQAPSFAPYLPDGSGRRANKTFASGSAGSADRNRTADEVFNMGAQYTNNYNINAQGYVDIDIIKGLSWKTTGALVFFNQDYKNREFPTEQPGYAFQPDANGNYVKTGGAAAYGNPPFSGLQQSWARFLTLTVNSVLSYTKNFGTEHHLNALAGYEQISNKNTSMGANRYNFISNSLNEINGGPTDGLENSGSASEYALQSLFGRANYNYQGKYFVEGDIRYDGTSRVDPKYRWGMFGGASAAWRLSEEKFIKKISWITDLKLRASYGVLGNQEIGNYPYQAVFNNSSYPYNGALIPGIYNGNLVTSNLHWEKTATTDVGLDLNIFKGLFGAQFDWYKKTTSDILAQQLDVPASLGLGAPIINAGAMENKGIELTLTHDNHIGEVSYGLNFRIAANRNKATKVLNETKGIQQVGLPWNSIYIYQMAGIFQSQDEINNSPAQPSSGNLKPGDIKIKDVNGDGKITADDRVSFSPYPKYNYSFGFYTGWKGFNLSAFFQGVQGQNFVVSGWGIDPFTQGTAPTVDFVNNAWTPDNHSNTTPALYASGYRGVSGYQSTYYLKDASYLRLKNINLSYTFSQKLLKANWLKQLTVYVSGSNLFTWTKYKGSDPERAGGGRYAQFPQVKILSGGLKISL